MATEDKQTNNKPQDDDTKIATEHVPPSLPPTSAVSPPSDKFTDIPLSEESIHPQASQSQPTQQQVPPVGTFDVVTLSTEPEGGPADAAKLNWWQKVTFSYVVGLVQKAQKKQLDMGDLIGLPPSEKAGFCYEEFKSRIAKKAEGIKAVKYILFHTFKSLYGKSWYIISQLLFLANPVLLTGLIGWVEHKSRPYYTGWVFGLLMVVLPVFASFFFNHGVILSMRISQKMRVALNMAVYDKALRMTYGKDGPSLGEIVDVLNNDANKIVNSFHEIIFGVIAPFQIIIITALIYIQIGAFAFVAIGTIAVLVLPNVFVAKGMHLSRKRMLGHTDERLRSTAEFIQGMRAIKCYVWEQFFLNRIMKDRQAELVEVRKFAYLKATLYFLVAVLPSMACLATFLGYVLAGNDFTPTKAFVTLSLLNMIRFPLAYIPVMIITTSANMVAFGRVQKFLAQPEATKPLPGPNKHMKVLINNADFSWAPNTGAPTLAKVNLELPASQFTIVVGTVGSGKSSLLQAILGEITKESGTIEVNGDIAYVPQSAWILNATVRDNILMGAPYDAERFKQVTDVCALNSDIEMLANGVHTQIGEKGVNLSGGQQQRASLARAVYSQRDIYLLDDCLSAVDQRVARHIFERCITGFLKGKCVVMVTNHVQFIPSADRVIVIKDNSIAGQFTKASMSSNQIVENLHNLGIDFTEGDKKDDQTKKKERRASVMIPDEGEELQETSENIATAAQVLPTQEVRRFSQFKPAVLNLVQDEERMKGSIPWSVYTDYVRTGGAVLFVIVAIMFSVALSSHAGGDYWLSVWTTDRLGWSSNKYLIIYAMFAVVELVLQSVGSFSLVGFGVKAASELHNRMLRSLANAKIGFFDANPLGRIMNRFSRDQDMLDTGITERMYQFFAALVLIIAILVILGVSSYWIAISAIPIAIAYFFLQKHYRRASIELKRLEGTAKSPLLAQMVETIAGVTSIRAFGLQNQFLNQFQNRVDGMNSAYYSLMVSTQWLGLTLDMLGVGVMLATVITIIAKRDTFNYGLVGLAITYATNLRFALNFSVLASTQTELTMNGAERIMEYSRLPQEPEPPAEPTPIPENWPTEGKIDFIDVDVRYRPGLDPVLRNINCTIQPGEKIGIVGRTGAGKSTFTSTMFRLVDVTEGQILIDGVDIMNVDVHSVRHGLTILPQNPMLFMGTVRQNIDPFNHYEDPEIWDTLEVVQLKHLISSFPLKLESPVEEDGDNYSQGQKQLICLARALLRKSKILILDEAMANIDFHTESIIQEAIHHHLSACTVLTIAHRLTSIMSSDRVMVMEKGRLMEMDSPANLLGNHHSKFYNMVNNINEVVE